MTTTKPRAVVDRPDSVTHFVCASAAIDTGDPDATHYMVNGRCAFCSASHTRLRAEVGL